MLPEASVGSLLVVSQPSPVAVGIAVVMAVSEVYKTTVGSCDGWPEKEGSGSGWTTFSMQHDGLGLFSGRYIPWCVQFSQDHK
jgi:hypothetical protein